VFWTSGFWPTGFWVSAFWVADTTVEVPDVVGLTLGAAAAALFAVDLSYDVTYEFSDTITEGEVISQNPVATTVVAVGSLVALTVSSGVLQLGRRALAERHRILPR